MAICPHCQEVVDERFHVLLAITPGPSGTQYVTARWRCDKTRISQTTTPLAHDGYDTRPEESR